MTSAVYSGRKALNRTNKQKHFVVENPVSINFELDSSTAFCAFDYHLSVVITVYQGPVVQSIISLTMLRRQFVKSRPTTLSNTVFFC